MENSPGLPGKVSTGTIPFPQGAEEEQRGDLKFQHPKRAPKDIGCRENWDRPTPFLWVFLGCEHLENDALFMRPVLATFREAGKEVWDLVSFSRDNYLLLCVPRL